MKNAENEIFVMTVDRESKIWSDAVFIFDSSAILDFYFLPISKRKEVFDSFRTNMSNRLWLPSHVLFEYQKNRTKIIRKPITEKYKPLKEGNIQGIGKLVSDIEKKLIDLKNQTKNDDKHPHLPQNNIDEYSELIKVFKGNSERILKSISEDVGRAEKEINELPNNDDVLKAVVELYSVGRCYTFPEIIEITKEGKHRFEYTIPPGYEDLKDKEKKGTQIFGDLIIWKQIIEYAKEINRPIIFVCNDMKEDWCYLEENSTEKRIERPREELIREIYDEAHVEFWMYNLAQFLHFSNKYIKTDIEPTIINEIHSLIDEREDERTLVLNCDNCGQISTYRRNEFTLDFDAVGTDSRSMGDENEYESIEYVECQNCGNEIEITFKVWEYPIGCHNYDEIEITGASLISSFPFSVNFYDSDDQEDEE